MWSLPQCLGATGAGGTSCQGIADILPAISMIDISNMTSSNHIHTSCGQRLMIPKVSPQARACGKQESEVF